MLGFKKLFKNDQGQPTAPVKSVATKIPGPSSSERKPSPAPEATRKDSNKDSNMMLSITLSGIFSRLPENIKATVKNQPSEDDAIELPANLVTQQLSKGKAHITFQQLKELSSGDFFDSSSDMDSTLVSLPLSEIIPQLKAGKNATKKTANPKVADGVAETDDELDAPMFRMAEPAKTEKAETAPRPSAPPPFTRIPGPGSAKAPSAGQRTVSPSPLAASAKSSDPAPRILTPKADAPSRPDENLEGTIPVALSRLVNAWPEAVMKEALTFENVDDLKVEFPASKIGPAIQQGKIRFNWSQIRSWIRPEVEKTVSDLDGTSLEIPLNIIVPLFLNHQKPVARKKAVDEMEDIPDLFGSGDFGAETSEEATAAPEPKPAPAPEPSRFSTPEKPKTPISPLAFASKEETPEAEESSRIPVAFKEEPAEKEEATAEIIPAPSAPVAPVSEEPDVKLPASGPLTLGRVFLQPEKSKWSMQEIVNTTVMLPGVSGALITMSDGLLIAASLPESMTADKIAAFVPKVFQKNSEICAQMGLGTPEFVQISLPSGPVVILRGGKSSFLVFGNHEHPLPMVQLKAIAKHLETHTK